MRTIRAALLAVLVTGLFGLLAGPAQALPLAPSWEVNSVAAPTNFIPGGKKGDYFYEVTITNKGGAATDGSDIVITDTLPAGLTVKSVDLRLPVSATGEDDFSSACGTQVSGGQSTVTCTVSEAIPGTFHPALLGPSEHLTALIHVSTPADAAGPLINVVEVNGGGAGAAGSQSENQASPEPAAAGFSLWRAQVTDGEGNPFLAAAGHPFQLTTSFAVNTNPAPASSNADFLPAGGDIKDIRVALPPGLIGNPNAAATCSPQQFTTVHQVLVEGVNFFINGCPPDSAVGIASLRQIEGHLGDIGVGGGPIYNLEPPKGMPAQLGFQIGGAPVYIDTRVRTGSDYGIDAHLRNTSEAKRISSAVVTIWGVPADPSHNGLRAACAEVGGSCPAGSDPRPFLRLPTSCASPLMTAMSFDTWTQPGTFFTEPDSQPAPQECELPDFSPSIQARPTINSADSPTGLHVNLHLPQAAHEEDPEGVGEADLRETNFTLPQGLVVNPASAAGLESCSEEQIGYLGHEGGELRFTPDPPHCPDAAKVGSVTVRTPLVNHPLSGAVYLASQDKNPFASLLAIYITISDPQSGVVVKIPAKVTPDPQTGQMTATATAPQTPFEDFELDFFPGDRAALRTPSSCGSYSPTARLLPWSAPAHPEVVAADTFDVASGPGGGPCPTGALQPKLSAGLENPTAATYSPFTLRISRADGTGEFNAISATPPPGMLAKLAGIPYCPEGQIAHAASLAAPGQGAGEAASPSCPQGSRVGIATAGAGAGPAPFHVSGPVYLAGPYKGAPLSLVTVVPALAGPFDLGTVTTRVALRVDPETAQVKAQSDALPTILSGIPLDLREVAVALDRPGFTLAPTNCEPMSIQAQVSSASGAGASASDRFQVGGCRQLRFSPALKLRLKGGTKRGQYPALSADLRANPGDANIASTSVAMPHSEFLAQAHIGTICTRVQFAAGACPKRSVYGKAKAWSPLLDQPLEGPVYLRSSNNPLPDLVAALRGQIEVDLVGRIDSHNGGIRTTFAAVPDAPVTRFQLRMRGGKAGLLQNSTNICGRPHKATVRMAGQNGRRHDFRSLLQVSCKKKNGSHKKHKKA
jgi:hypothetical protein